MRPPRARSQPPLRVLLLTLCGLFVIAARGDGVTRPEPGATVGHAEQAPEITVPEPAMYVMVGGGLLSLSAALRRLRKRASGKGARSDHA